MAPTVRIDDEVWEWLKQQARPLEDTPNSVLRRIAGLDPLLKGEDTSATPKGARGTGYPRHRERSSTMDTPLRSFTGEGLRRQHNLPVRHCLYHRDGTFYERLTRFPGALCDPQGYVKFETEQEFERDPRIRIGRKVNVTHGLFRHPKYRKFPSSE